MRPHLQSPSLTRRVTMPSTFAYCSGQPAPWSTLLAPQLVKVTSSLPPNVLAAFALGFVRKWGRVVV